MVLPVDIAHNLDGGLKLQQRGLVDQDCRTFFDEEVAILRAEVACGPRLLIA